MKHLLDVNALVAWWHANAHGHAAFHAWAKAQGYRSLATCAHVELDFIRISMQVFRLTLAEAQAALAAIKREAGGFVAEAPSPDLPPWSVQPRQTSDAFLSQVAASAGLSLATFDADIPGAVLIR
ncbi:MAG: hypothetical protein ACKOUK_00160 [Verrucomicrobiota bacterium]